MKPFLLIGLSLLALPLCTKAQYSGEAVKLEPAQPRPGQTITLTYSPAGTKLAKAPAVDGVIYWLQPKGETIAQSFTPTKSGGLYRATLTVPDTVQAMALAFEAGKTTDNNGNKLYTFLLYGPDGQPQPGSYASLSQVYSASMYYVGNEEKDIEQARRLMDRELALNPAAKRRYLISHFYAFNPGNEADRKTMKADLDALAALPDLTRDELESLSYFYQQARQEDQSDALIKRKEQAYGKTGDSYAAYQNFREQRVSLTQKKASYAKIQQEFGKDPEATTPLQYIYSTYLNVLADSACWDDFNALVKQAPADYKPMTMRAYNSIAWAGAEKGENLERGAELAKQATEWAKAQVTAPRLASDYSWQSDKKLRKSRQYTYGLYADTYGSLLVKQGKAAQALPYLKEAVTAMEGEDRDINERYIKALAQVDLPAVTREAEPLILENKASKGIEEALKAAYLKRHTDESGFAAYLARLKKTAAEQQKNELRERRVNRPAPAFTLVNLDGKVVSLASLKGKTVIVDFWATWCGPCVKSFPAMQKAVERFKADPNVAFVFVNTWQKEPDKQKNAADFLAKKQYPFNVLLDDKDEVVAAYGVLGIPTKFIIDKTGTIRFKEIGFPGGDDAMVDTLSMMIDLANEPLN